jgi:hypothetical protein
MPDKPKTPRDSPLLQAVLNLSRFHREHEKHYAAAPLEDALWLQRTSRTFKALAERWSRAEVEPHPAPSPFAGAPDLNDERAIETSGVLFMEGEGEPSEISGIKRRLTDMARANEGTGEWLGNAMQASWAVAEQLLQFPELAEILGERHRIIANDWQNANTAALISRHLDRAVAILDRVDFTPAALRADLAGPRHAGAYLFAATELIDHAADLMAVGATLVHDNERRWRVSRARVEMLVTAGTTEPG